MLSFLAPILKPRCILAKSIRLILAACLTSSRATDTGTYKVDFGGAAKMIDNRIMKTNHEEK